MVICVERNKSRSVKIHLEMSRSGPVALSRGIKSGLHEHKLLDQGQCL